MTKHNFTIRRLPLWLTTVLWLQASALSSVSSATPPVNRIWQERYAKGSPIREFRIQAYEANCRVCHRIKPTGLMEGLNNYGTTVGKFIEKSALHELNTDHEKRKTYIEDGLQKAGQERSSNGKTYKDLFDAGEGPWQLPTE